MRDWDWGSLRWNLEEQYVRVLGFLRWNFEEQHDRLRLGPFKLES